jgi:hypothetical protein
MHGANKIGEMKLLVRLCQFIFEWVFHCKPSHVKSYHHSVLNFSRSTKPPSGRFANFLSLTLTNSQIRRAQHSRRLSGKKPPLTLAVSVQGLAEVSHSTFALIGSVLGLRV